MGVATQRKGHGETGVKQRGSGECSASDDIYVPRNLSICAIYKLACAI